MSSQYCQHCNRDEYPPYSPIIFSLPLCISVSLSPRGKRTPPAYLLPYFSLIAGLDTSRTSPKFANTTGTSAAKFCTVSWIVVQSVVRLHSCTVVQLYSCAVVQLYSCTVVQLYSCTVVQLYSCTVVQL